jgi:hypothetical protein
MIIERPRDALSAGLLTVLALGGLAVLTAGVSVSATVLAFGALVGLAAGTALAAVASGRRDRDTQDGCLPEERPAVVMHEESPALPAIDEHPSAEFTSRVQAERASQTEPSRRYR